MTGVVVEKHIAGGYIAEGCSVLQYVAVCCSVLQCAGNTHGVCWS